MRPTRVELAELADLVAIVARHTSDATGMRPEIAEAAVRATALAERLALEAAPLEPPARCLGCQEAAPREGSPLCQACADDVARDLAAADDVVEAGDPGSLCSAACGYCGRCGGA